MKIHTKPYTNQKHPFYLLFSSLFDEFQDTYSFSKMMYNRFRYGTLQLQNVTTCVRFRKQSTKVKQRERVFSLKGDLISGYHSISLALEASKRKFYHVYYCENSSKVRNIIEVCNAKNIPTQKCTRKLLDQLVLKTSDFKAPHKGM